MMKYHFNTRTTDTQWGNKPKKNPELFGFFSLCSPNCPKQPRIQYSFYRFLYPIICGTIFGFGWNVADKYALAITKNLSLGCNYRPCSTSHLLIMHPVSTNHRKADQLNVMSLVKRSVDRWNCTAVLLTLLKWSRLKIV